MGWDGDALPVPTVRMGLCRGVTGWRAGRGLCSRAVQPVFAYRLHGLSNSSQATERQSVDAQARLNQILPLPQGRLTSAIYITNLWLLRTEGFDLIETQ
jgi:hypothetical protein